MHVAIGARDALADVDVAVGRVDVDAVGTGNAAEESEGSGLQTAEVELGEPDGLLPLVGLGILDPGGGIAV